MESRIDSVSSNYALSISASLYLDSQGKILGTKGETFSFLRADTSDLLFESLFGFLNEDDINSVRSTIDNCLATGKIAVLNLRFRGGVAERKTLFLPKDISAVEWPKGAVIKLLNIDDVLGEAISADRFSIDLFNTMLRDFNEGILMIDNSMMVIDINEYAAALLGDKQENLRGRNLKNYTLHNPGAIQEGIIRELTGRNQAIKQIEKMSVVLNENKSILLNFCPLIDSFSGITHYVVTLQLMTPNEKTAENILKIYDKLYQKIHVLSVHNSLSTDFNVCKEPGQLHPRITRSLVIGLGFHDTAAVLCTRQNDEQPYVLTSCFGIEDDIAREVMVKPENVTDFLSAATDNFPHFSRVGREGFSTCIYAPYIINGNVLGYLSLFRKSPLPFGREEAMLLKIIVNNLRHYTARRRAEQDLLDKVMTLSMLNSIGQVFQICSSSEQIAYTFLTSITAEQGLGLNRAFLFLFGDRNKELSCKFAIGPANPEEAGYTWQQLHDQNIDFKSLLEDFQRMPTIEQTPLFKLFKDQRFKPDENSIIQKSFEDKYPRVYQAGDLHNPKDLSFIEKFSCSEFLLVPLLASDYPLGVLIADNSLNGKPISKDIMRFVELVCQAGQQALERMKLNEELHDTIGNLRRSNELLHEHRQKMERLERLSVIGQMSASVAHEIRNPLASIGGLSRSISQDLPDDDPNKRYLDIIFSEVQRLERAVTDLLDFAKPVQINPGSHSIRELVMQTLEIMKPEFAKAQVSVSTRFAKQDDDILLDQDLFRQLVLNLLNNALAALPDGGRIVISSKIANNAIKLKITDTGAGIEKSRLEKIFEPFFTTTKAGTGLGLAIVDTIVKLHGGSISVRSKHGSGTTFIVILPRAAKN